jgi:hypothetical protein
MTDVQLQQTRSRNFVWTRAEFWLDVVLFIGYALAYSFGFTGAVLHEWIGLGLALALLLHLALHWEWLARTTRRLIRRAPRRRLLFAVNLALLVGMTFTVLSGICISAAALPALGIHAPSSTASFIFWKRLHVLTAKITLGLVPVHVALDWRWIVRVGNRILKPRVRSEEQ